MFKAFISLVLLTGALLQPASATATTPQAVQAQYQLSMNGTPIAVPFIESWYCACTACGVVAAAETGCSNVPVSNARVMNVLNIKGR